MAMARTSIWSALRSTKRLAHAHVLKDTAVDRRQNGRVVRSIVLPWQVRRVVARCSKKLSVILWSGRRIVKELQVLDCPLGLALQTISGGDSRNWDVWSQFELQRGIHSHVKRSRSSSSVSTRRLSCSLSRIELMSARAVGRAAADATVAFTFSSAMSFA